MKLYNSLSKIIEEFTPIKKSEIGMYVCGPTVYGPDHLGHARTWIFFDWLRRYLLELDYKVRYVQNITDVGHLIDDEDSGEDKIEKIAKELKKTPQEIAKFFTDKYFADLVSLNILKPDFSPRATEYIKEIIAFIEKLIEQKNAYVANGSVYFDVVSFADYGKLSGRKTDESKEGTRIKTNPEKKNQADSALWKSADESHLQVWDSPWGKGYPGWHIECSVMSEKLLGQPFDIHGSASEHIFPHHENEIAQSEARFNKPLANYFIHSGMLLIGGKKMSKSKGNYVTVEEVLKKYHPDSIKLAFMTTHWKKPFNWDEKVIDEANKVKERLVRAYSEAQPIKTGKQKLIREALEDDFNVPVALAVIMGHIGELSLEDFEYIKEIFGLNLVDEIKLTSKQSDLIKEREEARKKGDFTKSDEIRVKLEKEGILLEDTPSGTRIIGRAY